MKTILSGLSVCTLAGLAAPVCADDSANQYTLEIERQPIVAALTEFSKQTGLQVGYLPRNEREENTIVAPLSGQYTAESALQELLAPSGLAFERVNEKTLAVVAPRSSFQRVALAGDAKKSGVWRRFKLAEAEEPSGVASSAETAEEFSTHQKKSDPLEEVVVTAQKRKERLIDVPISITVLSGAELDSAPIEGVAEALSNVPGVAMLQNWNGMGARVAVRGVSAQANLFSGSSPIGYYLDSIPFAMVKSAITPDANVYDLERVEVLRGPQGTLYGASSLNGVVRILTQEPKLDKVEWKVRGLGSQTEEGGGNYRADMTVNVPLIGERLAVRVTGGYENLDGWIDRPNNENANDVRAKSLRLRLKAQPTDSFSADWSSWLSRTDYGAPNTGDENDRHGSPIDEPNLADYDVHALKLGYDFASFTLTSTSSYLDLSAHFILDFAPFCCAGLVVDSGATSKVFAQEILATSTDAGAWRWSLGAMYRDNRDRTEQFLVDYTGQAINEVTWWEETSESIAVYGEITRLLMNGRLELTGGLREFRDRAATQGTGPFGFISDRDTFRKLTPRVTVTGHVNEDLMVFATYSKGFRSGALQTPFLGVLASSEPDVLTNYEVGAKGEFWNKTLSIDTSVYYVDWQRVQQVFGVRFERGAFNIFTNGRSASGMGIDFALTVRPVSGLSLGANLSINGLELDSDTVTASGILYREGERLDGSPKETYGAFANYEFPLGGGGYRGAFSASGNYTTPITLRGLDQTGLTISQSQPQFISRLSFSVSAPQNWGAMIFVNNLNNERGIVGPQALSVPDWDARPRPRTYGVQLDYRF